jgi:hypothetical protein
MAAIDSAPLIANHPVQPRVPRWKCDLDLQSKPLHMALRMSRQMERHLH